ncbi:MAG: EamA family transporter [Planctomycetota bacterium]|nr:EamA family transporter [Planctomycetota bacterium]
MISKTHAAKTYIMLVLIVFFAPIGDVLLSKGMKQVGEVPDWSVAALIEIFISAFTNSTIWLGIGSLLVFFVCYLLVLSWADYSYAAPASAMSYVVVPLLGYMLLGEALTSIRWTGIIFIFLGVVLVNCTPHRTTRRS